MLGKIDIPFILPMLVIALLAVTVPGALAQSMVNHPQPPIIDKVLKSETDEYRARELSGLVNKLDSMYHDIYGQLRDGGKIRIYIDPAHGKINGIWRGLLSGRYCINGLPEEHYSILMLRDLYKHLSSNRYIEIITPDDHLAAMKGETDSYNDITFIDSINRAYEKNAHMIISEHLNNVAQYNKATSKSNVSGIHIVYDYRGRKYLTEINSIFKGFLTLYNKLDVTGFSRYYAHRLRNNLVENGFTPNSWENGAVADDRFIYFIDFPISLIYESAFISNPDDLARITRPESRAVIAKAQYSVLLDSVKNMFGVDISGPEAVKTSGSFDEDRITLLKLSRIALFYLKCGEGFKSANVITEMKKKYTGARYNDLIAPYGVIRSRVLAAENNYLKAQRYLSMKTKNRKAAKRNFQRAINHLTAARSQTSSKYYYAGLYRKYNNAIKAAYNHTAPAQIQVAGAAPSRQRFLPSSGTAERSSSFQKCATAPLERNIIFVIERNDTLETAIRNSLSPEPRLEPVLLESFKNAYTIDTRRVKTWSKKKRRMVYSQIEVKSRMRFEKGIYVVKLNDQYSVVSARRISKVHLNPDAYQNQQYLKNSHFANAELHKSL